MGPEFEEMNDWPRPLSLPVELAGIPCRQDMETNRNSSLSSNRFYDICYLLMTI